MTQQSEILTPKQLALMLDINRTTLGRWVKSGSIPAPVRINAKHVFWRKSTIEEWLQAKEAESAGLQK